MSTLLLNTDMQPISLLPLSTVNWQEAIRYMVLDKVEVLHWYEEWIVHSARWSTAVPAVIALKEYQKPKRTMRLTKRNIFLRDQYVCQYCGISVKESEATLDHVLPVSLGGRASWDNLATACKPCNYKKANKTKMKPRQTPYRPDIWELIEKSRKKGFSLSHPSWEYYLAA